MGYSLSVQCASLGAKNKLLAFLKANFRPITAVLEPLGFAPIVLPEPENFHKTGDLVTITLQDKPRKAQVEFVSGSGWGTSYGLMTVDDPANVLRTVKNQSNFEKPVDIPDWHGLCPSPEYAIKHVRTNLSYGKAKDALGFDYSGLNGIERAYIYAVISWAAIKVGKRLKGNPYIRYDSEKVPLAVGAPDPTGEAHPCDAYGWHDCSVEEVARLLVAGAPALAVLNAAARAEIVRLDQLWTSTT